MRVTRKWQQVVLAHGVERDIADQDDLVVLLGEHRAHEVARVLSDAAEDLLAHAGHSVGCAGQALALGILADAFEVQPNGETDLVLVDHGVPHGAGNARRAPARSASRRRRRPTDGRWPRWPPSPPRRPA